MTRTVCRTRLDQFGNRVQGHDHRRFGPLPDDERTGDGDGHQGVDIELPSCDRGDSLAVGIQSRKPDGDCRQGHAGECNGTYIRCKQMHDFHRKRDEQCNAQMQNPLFVCLYCGVSRVLADVFGTVSGLADGLKTMHDRVIVSVDRQFPSGKAAFQMADTADTRENPADIVFLDGAIHVFDMEYRIILRPVHVVLLRCGR